MIEQILANHKKSDEEVEREVEFTLHYDPIIHTPYFEIEGKGVGVDLAVSR